MASHSKRRACRNVDFKMIDLLEELKYENLVDEEKSEKGEFFDASVIQRPELKDGLLMTKVHYEGYGQEYDEWIPVTDVIGHIHVEPSDFPPVATYDLHRIKIKIKENLLLTRRMDTLTNIEESISIHTWSALSPHLQIVKKYPKRPTVFTIDQHKFGKLLGDESYFRRIVNEAGDIAQINNNTLQIAALSKRPLVDFEEVSGKLVKNPINRGIFLRISFVVEHSKYFD